MTHDELIKSLITERHQPRPKFDPDTPEAQAQRRKELAEAIGSPNSDRPALRVVRGRAAA